MSRTWDVAFDWDITAFSGWGVYGRNLALHWPADPNAPFGTRIHGARPANPAMLLNPLEQQRLKPFFDASAQLQGLLRHFAGQHLTLPDWLVMHALGNELLTFPKEGGGQLWGEANVGVVFLESLMLSDASHEQLKRYNLLLAGSTWNGEILREADLGQVAVVLQGINPALFHPAPRQGLLKDRFLIFSGGKLEHRKAQDLVLQAFKPFARRHPEALLVTAWASLWPYEECCLRGQIAITPPRPGPDGKVDTPAWAAENGIDPAQVLDLGLRPNNTMGEILREMDVALFPNRVEGGTNLVAMECMACGVPTILSANTGHLDLLALGGAIPLHRQTPFPEAGRRGWGESDVEEMVEALETVWRDREAARRLAEQGARAMATLSWRGQVEKMAATVLEAL